MGADVNIIIRNDFCELDNLEKSKAYVLQTIDKIKQRLHTDDDFNCIELCDEYYDEERRWSNVEFFIRLFGVRIRLAKGYWCVYSGCHTCQVTNKVWGRLHIAELAFDMAMLLGTEEAWYIDDYLEEECYENSLEEMLEIARSREGIVEYPYAELMKYEDWQFPAYEWCYHDSFEDIRKEYKELIAKCGDYKPTCIKGFGRAFVRVVKDGKINLLRRDTASVVFDSGVDDIKDFIESEMLCLKDGKTAMFDLDANPVTDFVNGEFFVSRVRDDILCDYETRIITNDEAQIKIMNIRYKEGRQEYRYLPYKSEIVDHKPMKCPICGGKVLPVVYGKCCECLRSNEYYLDVILGDEVATDVSTDWACVKCTTKFIKRKELF